MRAEDRAQVARAFGVAASSELSVLREQAGEPTVIRVGDVIYKRARYYDPLDSRPLPKTAWALFNEWAALDFLDGIAVAPRVSPRLISGDAALGVLTLQDLGEAPSLCDLLNGSDAGSAWVACIAHSRALGRLHRATIGGEEEYNTLRDALGPGGRHALYQDYGSQIEQFRRVCDAEGVDWKRCEADLREVQAAMERPEPAFAGLLHGDVGPGNEKLVGANLVLIDFEVAGFGHVLREAVAARLVFTEGDNSAILPSELVAAMEKIYRAEFGPMGDDWVREYATSAAFHVVAEVAHDFVTNSVGWRTVHRCRALLEVVDETAHLHSLGTVIEAVSKSLPTHEPPPAYPAFRRWQNPGLSLPLTP